ncbi:putative disease resistance protein RGA4 [Morella rubra]|uniref:Putative disease resistance protein RGA4 n=1 Tax=Morella rubra TaxID=262757 RepID=A0A6A1WDB5_9ROSI|nr:putative disease resistance protein RGA4 [Morella rubra]
MAELAFGIAEKVLEKLESSVYQELRLACGVKSDVERLKGTMSTIKNVLLDAEEKQATDRKLRDWLGQLRDVFYNAEDVLDEIQCEALRKQVVKTYGSTGEKDFNLTRLVKEILKSAGLGFDEDSITVEMLQTSLRELIKKRKFLLVLDDVWNDELGKWIELRDLLVGGSKGSKILVTTRSQSVASIVGTVPSYTLKGSGQELSKHLDKLASVRTAMFQTTPQLSLLEACILRFEYLRVLNLSRSSLEVLPSSIDTLKHLRYLNLSDNDRIQKLPNSICKLHNLQTLLLLDVSNLNGCPKI